MLIKLRKQVMSARAKKEKMSAYVRYVIADIRGGSVGSNVTYALQGEEVDRQSS